MWRTIFLAIMGVWLVGPYAVPLSLQSPSQPAYWYTAAHPASIVGIFSGQCARQARFGDYQGGFGYSMDYFMDEAETCLQWAVLPVPHVDTQRRLWIERAHLDWGRGELERARDQFLVLARDPLPEFAPFLAHSDRHWQAAIEIEGLHNGPDAAIILLDEAIAGFRAELDAYRPEGEAFEAEVAVHLDSAPPDFDVRGMVEAEDRDELLFRITQAELSRARYMIDAGRIDEALALADDVHASLDSDYRWIDIVDAHREWVVLAAAAARDDRDTALQALTDLPAQRLESLAAPMFLPAANWNYVVPERYLVLTADDFLLCDHVTERLMARFDIHAYEPPQTVDRSNLYRHRVDLREACSVALLAGDTGLADQFCPLALEAEALSLSVLEADTAWAHELPQYEPPRPLSCFAAAE